MTADQFLTIALILVAGGVLFGASIRTTEPLLDVAPRAVPEPDHPWQPGRRVPWVPPCPEVRRLNASCREWRRDVRKGAGA